jgi:hypothetical protein
MSCDDFQQIYNQMMEVYKRDKELTHIEVIFNIKEVQTEKKTAIINIKTYK